MLEPEPDQSYFSLLCEACEVLGLTVVLHAWEETPILQVLYTNPDEASEQIVYESVADLNIEHTSALAIDFLRTRGIVVY